jgi:hypothetical protein
MRQHYLLPASLAHLARREVHSGQTPGGGLPNDPGARRQYGHLMGRGRHVAERKRSSEGLLLNIGRSDNRNLVPRDRKAHQLKSWKLAAGHRLRSA